MVHKYCEASLHISRHLSAQQTPTVCSTTFKTLVRLPRVRTPVKPSMSGTKNKKKQSQKVRGSSAVTSAAASKAAPKVQVSQQAPAPATRVSGDCDVAVRAESSNTSQASQQKPDIQQPKISRQVDPAPSSAAAAPQPSPLLADEEHKQQVSGTTSATVTSQEAHKETATIPQEDSKPMAGMPRVAGIDSTKASATAATTAPPAPPAAASHLTPSTPSSTWVNLMNFAVQAYTKPVYYTAGAAAGVMSAVRQQLKP